VLNLQRCGASFAENAPPVVIDEVIAKLLTLLEQVGEQLQARGADVVQILSPRLFFEISRSASTSKGFLVSRIGVVARASCSISGAQEWNDSVDLTQVPSPLHDG
jgi:hypothetical protein